MQLNPSHPRRQHALPAPPPLPAAGEPIATRWTPDIKAEVKRSRVATTQQLAAAINACPPEQRPKVLVNSSAVGYYGSSEVSPVGCPRCLQDGLAAAVVVLGAACWSAAGRGPVDVATAMLPLQPACMWPACPPLWLEA